jgi:ABC-2 type transport system permease protein
MTNANTNVHTKLPGSGYGLLQLEFRKLIGFRSVRLGLIVAFFIPILLTFAPDTGLSQVVGTNLILVSGWQVPGLTLYIVMPYLLPLLVAVTCSEIIGGEVAWGTLAPLLLRPVSRTRIALSKLFVAVMYPIMLLLVTLIGGLLIGGLRFGFGSFAGGTGLAEGGFNGFGILEPATAFFHLGRAYLIAGLVLAPLAALGVVFGILFLNTAAAALASVASIILMRMLAVFVWLKPLLLTEHLNAYTYFALPPEARVGTFKIEQSLILLLLYTIGCVVTAIALFERKDL